MGKVINLSTARCISPPIKRFYCVYRYGLAEYQSFHLDKCLRYIARELGDMRLHFITAKQAVDAGFKIQAV